MENNDRLLIGVAIGAVAVFFWMRHKRDNSALYKMTQKARQSMSTDKFGGTVTPLNSTVAAPAAGDSFGNNSQLANNMTANSARTGGVFNPGQNVSNAPGAGYDWKSGSGEPQNFYCGSKLSTFS